MIWFGYTLFSAWSAQSHRRYFHLQFSLIVTHQKSYIKTVLIAAVITIYAEWWAIISESADAKK